MPNGGDVSLDARIRDTARASTSFVVPIALSAWLDRLVDAAVDAGEDRRLSRTDVVCALIATTTPDGREVRDRLEDYRNKRVRELVMDNAITAGENVVSIRARGPGPRRRR